MPLRSLVLGVAAVFPLVGATTQSASANPVRKVVQMLQSMTKKVTEEGEREKELFDKFMCYCKTGAGDLATSIENAETKIPQLTADLKAGQETLKETKEGLKQDEGDRAATKEAIAEATEMRKKEHAEFEQTKDEYVANIKAAVQAAQAIEKGSAGAFLQSGQASRLHRVISAAQIMEEDKDAVLAFLSASSTNGYAPQSGQIIGILKQMADSMSTNLARMMAMEEKSLHVFNNLVKAKTAEVDALTDAVEAKTTKIGELGVFCAEAKDEIDDLSDGLAEDKVFLKELEKGCDAKQKQWDERRKTRAQELQALAETIKILNDDDALELFKKTLPAAGSSFLQLQVSPLAMREEAVNTLRKARAKAPRHNRAKLDMILLSLNGKKKADFGKVIKLIDTMIKMLADEQKEDEKKRDYCEKEFDEADDKKKSLEDDMETEFNNIKKAEAAIATLGEEILALGNGIRKLDKEVAEATAQRKDENAEYKDLIAANSAAKELLEIAKNRLNKFYNPEEYKPQAKQELSGQDRVVVDMGNPDGVVTTTAAGGIAGTGVTVFAQVAMHQQQDSGEAPPPPPETFDAYTKKGEDSTGVIQMINMLITELVTDMTEGKASEKDAQADYEVMMSDAAKKRAEDSKTLADKEKVKADTEVDLESHKAARLSAFKEHQATLEYIASLHAECDWLMQFFDVRKEARAGEVQALTDAKAVLNGADYSLIQTGVRHRLRRSA